ncbi:MAG: Na+/H+ antiporter subunit E [Armatimonadota bacterium]|nr:Na+/H+ antiporter subunit E [Armatimonadota bacterium]MDR7438996.1 Na+/H+ antiporter subunit E [Armatimonadota bacterium]MDR7563264.1 Na+/H+ antiporter subunit E [Armatimonadota bacterium]MDR7566978.1 Na+/H+ antiporter subunit E [Armatimonadota bacterium]MDR7602051.1 Na+/H+ antiporter subunit E [Armatimonadota bacterium]
MRRLVGAFCFVVVFAYEVMAANLAMAALLLNPRRGNRPGFVRFPLRVRRPAAITALANAITMTPGTMTVDVAPDRSALLVHVFDLEDPQDVVRRIRSRLERWVAEVFE